MSRSAKKCCERFKKGLCAATNCPFPHIEEALVAAKEPKAKKSHVKNKFTSKDPTGDSINATEEGSPEVQVETVETIECLPGVQGDEGSGVNAVDDDATESVVNNPQGDEATGVNNEDNDDLDDDVSNSGESSQDSASAVDRPRNCLDCREPFVLEDSNKQWFLDRGLSAPKRCLDCRRIAKGVKILHQAKLSDNRGDLEQRQAHRQAQRGKQRDKKTARNSRR